MRPCLGAETGHPIETSTSACGLGEARAGAPAAAWRFSPGWTVSVTKRRHSGRAGRCWTLFSRLDRIGDKAAPTGPIGRPLDVAP